MLAVFLIVTLATIGLYLITVSTGQVQAVAQDEQAVRAYQAARAGLERGMYQRLISLNCTVPANIAFTNPGLTNFFAEITCVQVGITENEGTTPISVFLITSRGCNANPCSPATPGPTYVERELQVTVTQ
jgi:MSHA biogenesis protein MshP